MLIKLSKYEIFKQHIDLNLSIELSSKHFNNNTVGRRCFLCTKHALYEVPTYSISITYLDIF